jgi:Histidine kinase-, DNA gyrase B-, and HSP90-like ATPase
MKSLKLTDLTAVKLVVISVINRLLPFFILKRLPIASMVNQERVRSSIRRMFSNSAKEALSELFQNSQRAGASRVTIKTTATGFIVADNGTGLDGISGFHALLRIAESQYASDKVESDQRPMGVGVLSLISHDQVSKITFTSGSLELEIDTHRWFEDERYYTTWFKRLKSLKTPVGGLTITVECSEKMVEQLKEALKPQHNYKESSAAQGYDGILEIELDGKPVETTLPRWAKITRVLVDTDYMGSRLWIGFTDDGSAYMSSTVNWYGQLIKFDFCNTFTVHLEVREGHPVNPRSPVREGFIANEAYERFIAFAKDALFRYLFAPENRPLIEASWVIAYYKLDPERALREAPYYVASPRQPVNGPGSVEDMDTNGDPKLFAYADEVQPLLLRSRVILLLDGKAEEVDYGLASFIPQIGPAYILVCGNRKPLSIGRLYWRPGQPLNYFFYEPGEYGISFTTELPESFSPVTEDDIFIFRQSANWDPEEAEFVVATTDQISFLYVLAWACWNYDHDEASYNELKDAFESSIKATVRSIMGNCVSSTFSLYDLTPFFREKNSRVESIRVIYSEQGTSPEALSVTSTQGETVKLSLMY